ncbi:uncharacterized protein NPIL_136881 [Nephila pilipes]|uniref:Uncharacterized protein n=1 Tax=Nephila pilipes TaxID=299642 RepID=A0A8X6ULE7_NEPPI|nr:uncharacterized protein NPIL_136881 [Nephila pilipes]
MSTVGHIDQPSRESPSSLIFGKDMVSKAAVLVILAWVLIRAVSCEMWEDTYKLFGCKGTYDKYKMAHLERICDECYEIYKKPDLHIECRRNCFGGTTFFKCMETVALDEYRKEQVLISWDNLRKIV